jgi:tetratricopeptide (TPR) repeat protein
VNRRIGLSWLVVALALSAASVASASDADDARAAVRRGLAAMSQGDAEAALAEYESAKRLAPDANAPWFYAADALDKLGRWRDAATNLETYLAKDPSVSDAADVKARIATLRAQHFPARVRIVVDAPGAELLVDGEPRDAAATLELPPGPHRFEARAPGRELRTTERHLVGDTEVTVELVLLLLPPTAQEPPPPLQRQPDARSPSVWRPVGFATAGVGAAALVATLIVDVAALGPKVQDFRSAANRFDPSARDLRSEAEELRTLTVVGYAAGSVLLAGGLVLALFAPKTVTRAVGVGPSGFRWAL